MRVCRGSGFGQNLCRLGGFVHGPSRFSTCMLAQFLIFKDSIFVNAVMFHQSIYHWRYFFNIDGPAYQRLLNSGCIDRGSWRHISATLTIPAERQRRVSTRFRRRVPEGTQGKYNKLG